MDYKTLLNQRQLEAVTTTSQYTRVVAGAGSGKTRVLTYRIAYLISEMNVDPFSILAIAFTNKVANEMKERIVRLLPDVSPYLHISTFHSFGARFLRKEIHNIGISNSFTIFDDDDTERLIKEICLAKGYSKKDDIIKQSIRYISSKKCQGLYPEDIKTRGYLNEEECLEIFKEYENRKLDMIALDFDDLLLKTINVLELCPQIREKWQHRLKHILIDEFQDTNNVQFKLLKLLCNENTNVYVVGDPDQTIYTWRGADQNIILNYDKNFKPTTTIVLDCNYRSTKTILDAANKLISHNKKRIPKDLYTNNVYGEKIELFKGATKEVEAAHVVSTINKLKNQCIISSLRDVAILYRSSYLTLPLEKELIKEKLKYRIFGGVRFYQRKEIKDALAYFRLIVNPNDDISFDRIINVPKRKIGEKSVEILKKEAKAFKLSYYEYIRTIGNYASELAPRIIESLTLLVSQIEKVKSELTDDGELYSKILEDFLIEIGYFAFLELDDNADERIGNLKTLFTDMFDFIKKNPEDGFQTWLENCTLATSQDDMSDDDYISLMTVHTAKGLEFNYVFIIGLADSVFPNQRAVDERNNEGLEEERRLAYVAFTRAKKKLYLSMNNGYSFVLESNPIESRFIDEAGLKMPSNPMFSSRENYPRVRYSSYNLYNSSNSDNYDIAKVEDEPLTNGINDWKEGDLLEHDKFGKGTVKKIIDNNTFVVDFVNVGTKMMLSSHKMIHKIRKVEDMN